MGHQRLTAGVFSAVLIGLTLGAPAPVRAQSLTVKTDDVMIEGGHADFGSGFHGTGHPFSFGHIKWEFSTVNGSLVAKATVTGTVYYDSLNSPGCARLFITFISANKPAEQRTINTPCPAPGGDANLSANQKIVNESFSSAGLKSVRLLTQEGQSVAGAAASTNPIGSKSSTITPPTVFQLNGDESPTKTFEAPNIKKHDLKLNNGNADFGAGLHALGGPTGNGALQLSQANGSVTGLVNGTLYWDALIGAGCTRMIIDFQTLAGSTLSSKTIDQCGPGGNANDATNKKDVNQSYTDGSLMQIRVRVGTVVNDSFVNAQTKTCDFVQCR